MSPTTPINEDTGYLRIVRKGGKAATAPLNPITVRALDAYLADDHPTSGPLFLDRTKSKRLAYTTAYEMIQRLARKAGIPAVGRAARNAWNLWM